MQFLHIAFSDKPVKFFSPMNTEYKNLFEYYCSQSPYSDPKSFGYLFDGLPQSLEKLVKIVQGLIIHRDATNLYGFEVPMERLAEAQTRYVEKILEHISELDNSEIKMVRKPEKKFVGICRDFAILLCALLRHKAISARVRCGFADYFIPGKYEDHWICEYWNAEKERWIFVDPEIDEVIAKCYKISFNPLAVSSKSFLTAGRAWQMCRNGKADPNNFGVSMIDIKGLWFVLGSVLRDLAALNKVEVLPWDYWGISDKNFDTLDEEELNLIDRVVALTADFDNVCFQEIQQLYENDRRLKASAEIKSYTGIDQYQMVKIY